MTTIDSMCLPWPSRNKLKIIGEVHHGWRVKSVAYTYGGRNYFNIECTECGATKALAGSARKTWAPCKHDSGETNARA